MQQCMVHIPFWGKRPIKNDDVQRASVLCMTDHHVYAVKFFQDMLDDVEARNVILSDCAEEALAKADGDGDGGDGAGGDDADAGVDVSGGGGGGGDSGGSNRSGNRGGWLPKVAALVRAVWHGQNAKAKQL